MKFDELLERIINLEPAEPGSLVVPPPELIAFNVRMTRRLMNIKKSALADLPQSSIDELVNQRQLIHRIGTPDDVVPTVMFLCSDEARLIHGAAIPVRLPAVSTPSPSGHTYGTGLRRKLVERQFSGRDVFRKRGLLHRGQKHPLC